MRLSTLRRTNKFVQKELESVKNDRLELVEEKKEKKGEDFYIKNLDPDEDKISPKKKIKKDKGTKNNDNEE